MPPRKKWLLAAACLAAALALISAGDARGFRRYFLLKQDLVKLAEKNRALVEQNARLSREIQAMRKDPEALERAAREELGFVKPGEVVLDVE